LVKQKTKFYDVWVKGNQKCFSGLPQPSPGEIDVIAIFPETAEIYLIDAKDTQFSRVPRDMSNEIEKYIQKGGYFELILKKKEFILKYLDRILKKFGLGDIKEEWKIKCVFVTSNISLVSPFEETIFVLSIAQFKNLMDKQ
jgi:hypothetical protein